MILWVRRKNGASVETGENGSRAFRTTYTVKSNRARELRTTILNCGMLPVYGSPHPQDPTAICVKVSPVQNSENPFLWEVACEWSNQHGNQQNPLERQKQPDERRARWSFNFTPIPKTFFKDLDGKPFEDTAHTPFNPPPEIPIYVDEVTVVRYEATCNRAADRIYLNATNTDNWLGAAPGEALISDIARNEIFENGSYWFETTYKILVSPKIVMPDGEAAGGWDPIRVLNAGPRELDRSTPPKPVPIQTGEYYDGLPCALDENGRRIPLDNTGHWTRSPILLHFRVVNRIAFAGLNLVPPWI